MPVKASRPKLTRVGCYEILDTIGKGGMGTVYRAQHQDTGEPVAIKVVRQEWAADPVLCRRFEREFRAAWTLKHPNIVQGIDFGLEGDVPYFVMELVEGESLWAKLYREGRLPEAEAVRIILQIAQALEMVHQNHYIHRDIKPDNILLTTSGVAKLTDLGLVKSLEADVDLTQGGEIIGTPHYCAPEQFDDPGGVDVRADIYGLGATLYSAVTGLLPFQNRGKQNYLVVLKKKMVNDLTPPRKLVPDLSEAVDFAIRRSCRADKAQRHASCAEFILALTGKANPEDLPDRTRRTESQFRRTERRASVRYQTVLESQCEPLALQHEKCWSAQIKDISVNGLRLILPRRFEPGTFLTIDIHSRDRRSKSNYFVKVVRVHQEKPRHWALGCVFLQPLTPFELKSLL